MGKNTRKRPVAPAPNSKSRWPAILTVLGVIVGLALIVLASKQSKDSEKSLITRQLDSPTIEGEALPTYAATAADKAIGMTAPTVKGKNFDDEAVTLGPNGNAHLVTFMAHWCPHCNAEAPTLAEQIAKGVPDGVDVTVVSAGASPNRANWPPQDWISQMKLKGEGVQVIRDPGLEDKANADPKASANAAYGLDGFPYVVLLDKDMKVLGRYSGEQPEEFWADVFSSLEKGQAPGAEAATETGAKSDPVTGQDAEPASGSGASTSSSAAAESTSAGSTSSSATTTAAP